ncbi:MAG: hypothetical protein JWR05_1624 [Mucilaginibacter sp.]|nr:hypothetical protein [Mucilaginibacter sp.]
MVGWSLGHCVIGSFKAFIEYPDYATLVDPLYKVERVKITKPSFRLRREGGRA